MFKRLFTTKPAPTLSSLEAYAKWATSYPPHAHNTLMQAEETAMLALLPDVRGQTALDLACGTGRYGQVLAERGARRVISLDNSLPMLEHGRPAGAIAGTLERLPIADECADGVVCALALGHLPDLDAPMREIGRVLKPGGWALVSDFHPFLALSGAQRTFNAGGRTFAVEHYAHLYSDYARAAAAAGLAITAVDEPRIAQPNAPVQAKTPVALVFQFTRL